LDLAEGCQPRRRDATVSGPFAPAVVARFSRGGRAATLSTHARAR